MALSSLRRWTFRWQRRLLFWGGAIVVSLTAIAFAIGGDHAQALFRAAIARWPWLPLVLTPLGFALAAALTRHVFPHARGSGIPQTIAALELRRPEARDGLLSLRIAFGKLAVTLLGLACGASVGREGPTVQVGASVMHALGRLHRRTYREIDRGLILAGGAAGIAAAFNTPLAGIVFAIEELWHSFDQRTNGTILTAVIFSGMTSLWLLGDYTYFGRTAVALPLDRGWLAVPMCGVAGGVLGGLFARALTAFGTMRDSSPARWIRAWPVTFAAACGLATALLGYLSDHSIYGTGYAEARLLVAGTDGAPATFGLLKMLATILSAVSGIPGGIFAPSLATGAGFGADLAVLLPQTPHAALAILGMVGYFTGVAQAPLTALVIVMEMTDDRAMLMPLMATALIAQAVSRLIAPVPLYRTLAAGFLAAYPESELEHAGGGQPRS